MNAWLKRWQEFSGWMPLVAFVAMLAWVALGGVSSRDDLVHTLIELPVKVLYAIGASGVTYLVWRRWSFRMDDEQQRVYWAGLLAGEAGPLIVYLTNTAFFACTFIAVLFFFSR